VPHTFPKRITHLMNEVGDGSLIMGSIVQQPYAGAEHNRLYYKHPRGGIAKWLTTGIEAERDHWMRVLTLAAVTPDGSLLDLAAIDVSERMSGITRRYAPIQSGLLRDSADSYVTDAGKIIYYREQSGPYNKDKDG
jgi:hypothetical protein